MYKNLQAEQARNKLTNAQVADKIGISRVAYEQKKKSGRFHVAECKTLCVLFGCEFEYLFDLDNGGDVKPPGRRSA